MRLRAIGFSPNGRGDLRGTIVAYSDAGEPLGVEHTGNYSRDGARGLLKKMGTIGADPEVAQAQLARLLAQLRRNTDEAIAAGSPLRERERPRVCVTDRPLRELEDDTWALLLGANARGPRFFLFGDTLAEVDGTVDPIRPHPLSVPALRHHVDRLGDYMSVRSVRGEEEDEHPARPPQDMLESMLAVVSAALPALVGVVNAPFIAPDGNVVAAQGYHQATGLYLALGALALPPVPPAPSDSDIAHARQLLMEDLLGDFPFVEEADRGHALAAILTPLVRPLVGGPTPLFVIEAPVEGTGKGLLAYSIGCIATGGPPAVMVEGGDDSEWRKRLTAALMGTPPILLIDNVRHRLEAGPLSAAITAMTWTDRLLGQSRMVSIPVRTTWLATGNNPSYSGEIARRVVRIRIDATVERPWERVGFRHEDLSAWARQERPHLLWAALTLARAWVSRGRPQGKEAFGSFENWAATLGGMLAVTGVQGFLGNREAVYARAYNEGEAWRALLDLWWATYSDRRVGVGELFELASREKLLTDLRAGRTERGARTSLGMELSRLRDRIVGNLRVREAGRDPKTGAAMYRLEAVSGGKKVTKVTEVTASLISGGQEPQEPQEPFFYPATVFEDTSREALPRCLNDPALGCRERRAGRFAVCSFRPAECEFAVPGVSDD